MEQSKFKSLEVLERDNLEVIQQLRKEGLYKSFHLHNIFWSAVRELLIAKLKDESIPKYVTLDDVESVFSISDEFSNSVYADIGLWRVEDQNELLALLMSLVKDPEGFSMKSDSVSVHAIISLLLALEEIRGKEKKVFYLNLSDLKGSRHLNVTPLIVKLIVGSKGQLRGRNALRALYSSFWIPLRRSVLNVDEFQPPSVENPIELNPNFLLSNMTLENQKATHQHSIDEKSFIPDANKTTVDSQTLVELNRLREENDKFRELGIEGFMGQILSPFLKVSREGTNQTISETIHDQLVLSTVKSVVSSFLSQTRVEIFANVGDVVSIKFPSNEYVCIGNPVLLPRNQVASYSILQSGVKIDDRVVFPAQVMQKL